MKYYFYLLIVMTNRKFRALGVHSNLAYPIGLILYIAACLYLFQLTPYAPYLVVLAAVGMLSSNSGISRSAFLQITFGEKKAKRIRMLENLILTTPFITVLLFQNALLAATILLLISITAVLVKFKPKFNPTLPTPFSKNPFEFALGFRKSFLLFPLAYALTIIALLIDNLNLGIFSLVLLLLTSYSYYLKPENEYYVWVYAATPAAFLMKKIGAATKYTLFILLPGLLALLGFYPHQYDFILLFSALGILFLWTIIFAKYSAYPGEINIGEGILIALCIYFPPLLIAIIPFFYYRSLHKLNPILHDKN